MDITVAIDCMGGDHGPRVTVPAALDFQRRQAGVAIVLVGPQDVLEAELRARHATSGPRLRVQHASEQVSMDEPPAQALRFKKDSSMRVAVNLVKSGAAHACVSAGNTAGERPQLPQHVHRSLHRLLRHRGQRGVCFHGRDGETDAKRNGNTRFNPFIDV